MEKKENVKRFKQILENFRRKKIIVFGDVSLDEYILGEANNLSPEFPVPRAIVKKIIKNPGAAANVAINLAKLGAEVNLIGVIGKDDNGQILLNKLKKENVKTDCITIDENRITSTFSRVMLDVNKKNSQHLVRIDYENTKKISLETKNKIKDLLKEKIDQSDCIFIADYDEIGTGIVNSEIIDFITNLSEQDNKLTVGISRSQINIFKNIDMIILNKKELSEAIGKEIESKESFFVSTNFLRNNLKSKTIFVTLAEEGLICSSNDKFFKIPSFANEVVDACGAGDSLSSVVTLSILSGASIEEACELGSIASSIVISKEGTIPISYSELEFGILNKFISNKKYKIFEQDTLELIIKNAKKENKKIIFANGFFDFIHGGHIKFLQEAKKLGDILVVAINSDESTRSNKGINRPFINQNDRAKIISSFDFVDYVTIFDELTPINIIRKIEPDILVKGGKTKFIVGKEIVESQGGKTTSLPLYGVSTEEIIESIRSNDYSSNIIDNSNQNEY